MFKKTNSNSFLLNESKKTGLTESEYALNVATLFITSIYAFYEKKYLVAHSSELDTLYKRITSLRNNFSSDAKSNQKLLINKALYSKIFDGINDDEPILLSKKEKQEINRELNAYAKPNNSFHKKLIWFCFIVSLGLLYPLFHFGQESFLFSYLWGGCIGFFLSGLFGLLTFTNLFYKHRIISRTFSNYYRFTFYYLSELITVAGNQFDKIDYNELTTDPISAISDSLKTSIDSFLTSITENSNSLENIKTEINKLKKDLFEKIDSSKDELSSNISESAEDLSNNFFLAMGDVTNPDGFLNKRTMDILLNPEHSNEEKEFIYIIKNKKFWIALNSLCNRISEDSSLCMNAEQFAFVFFKMYEHFFKTHVPGGNNHTYQILFRILKEGKFVTGEESTVRNKLILYKRNELPFHWQDGTNEKDKPEKVEAGEKMREFLKGMGIKV